MVKKKARAKAKPKASKKSKPRKAAKSKAKAKKVARKRTTAKSKKPAKAAKPIPKPGVIAPAGGILLGFVEDYFAKIGVIALTLKAPVSAGQRIQVLGHTTNFEQPVESMQIDHAGIAQAKAKDAVGIKVSGRSRRGDHVYLLK